jgi:hypothetical protein
MLETGESTYIVPRGKGVGDPIILNISAVMKAESRLRDVAHVNPHTAPELLAVFNEHWLELNHNVTALTYERNEADAAAKVAYAEAILDCNDEFFKKKGHTKGSQDLREAAATVHPKVISSLERLNEIKTVLSYMLGKMQAFENAYNSVKKIIGLGVGMPPEKASFGGFPTDRQPQEYVVRSEAAPDVSYSRDVLDGFSDHSLNRY